MHWRRYRRLERLVTRLEAEAWGTLSVHAMVMRRRLCTATWRRSLGPRFLK